MSARVFRFLERRCHLFIALVLVINRGLLSSQTYVFRDNRHRLSWIVSSYDQANDYDTGMTSQSRTIAYVCRRSNLLTFCQVRGGVTGDQSMLFVYIHWTFHDPINVCYLRAWSVSDAILRECHNYFDPFTSLPIFGEVLSRVYRIICGFKPQQYCRC